MGKVKKHNKRATKNATAEGKSVANVLGLGGIIRNENIDFSMGFILLGISIFLICAMVSYFVTGEADQSLVIQLRPGELISSSHLFKNVCGSTGAVVSHLLITRCFGLASFLIPVFMILASLHLIRAYKVNLMKWFMCTMIVMIWLSVFFAKFLTPIMDDEVFNPGGDHGAMCCQFLDGVIGSPGLMAVLSIVAVIFLTYISSETISFIRHLLNPIEYLSSKVIFRIKSPVDEYEGVYVATEAPQQVEPQDINVKTDGTQETDAGDSVNDLEDKGNTSDISPTEASDSKEDSNDTAIKGDTEDSDGDDIKVLPGVDDESAKGATVSSHYDLNTPINPREPFLKYQFPTLNLLKKYDNDSKPLIDKEELLSNKKRIVEVLNSFGVQIREITASLGPTITLYEITPAEGVRISKIRGLEDDIALSLAALGIRIIAPIPGKGTIGIEVPNAKPSIVSMESILNSRKFQDSSMELPIALGKTITNEVFMIDLAKQPHLLVAGATGQGKSVGLNAIITSLLYKKHPNELKIVLVDPKKVEFSVYGPIANHFMAAVDEDEDPIITDVTKVVRTLKSLCALMDKRYDLLKVAGARNIKEYNQKYLNHKLSPLQGHEYMPYIVVIIDEFGDLIMTAGKEVELPIARIAQLARAVGIHMIIATQRPTTSIITGNIKANFPGRIAFRVGAMIDSRTILDRPGANQLVGRGDMLFLNGAEPVRVQCAFVDTPEVERISEYIANQPGPLHVMDLPEPPSDSGDGSGGIGDSMLADLDPLFEEVSRFIVGSNQGSTSAIQRKFSIGYNRAGRIMDQIERAGIVGAAQGSKPREVLITDLNSLETLFENMRQ